MKLDNNTVQGIINDFKENPFVTVRSRAKRFGVSEYLVRKVINSISVRPTKDVEQKLLDVKSEFYIEQRKMLDLIYKLFDIALEEPIVGPIAQKAKEFLLKQKA